MPDSPLITVAIIVVLGAAAQWLAWRSGLPSILLLLLAGFVAGPVAGWVHPDQLLGDLLLPLVSLSVAVILYEGGLTLRIAELSEVGGVVRRLVSLGALVTWVVSAVAAYFLFEIGLALSLLLGAILVVTGPTVIQPMLRHIRPSGRVERILKWEGIVIDPIGAVLAVLVFEAVHVGNAQQAAAQIVLAIVKTVVVGGGLGIAAAALLALLIRRYWIPDYLHNAISLMFVVAAFTGSNLVQHESGLLAATVMGIVLANQHRADVRHIVEFKENLRVLLISALFILLAARVEVADLWDVLTPGALFVAVLLFMARPASAWLSTHRAKLSRAERLFLAFLAPRGIVAAAVASVFALRLEEAGYEQARTLVPITFVVIIGTVAVYGLLSPLVARKLGVADANPQGILFVGADRWVRALAELLKSKGYRVLLVDTNREHTAAARMAGLPTHTDSALADHILDDIELGGIGRLFAVTPNEWVNILVVQRFARVFGRSKCYQLPPANDQSKGKQQQSHLHGRSLFAEGVTHTDLEYAALSGATVKATPITEEFTLADFTRRYGQTAVPMLLLDENGLITVIAAEKTPEPQPGQTLVALVHEQPE